MLEGEIFKNMRKLGIRVRTIQMTKTGYRSQRVYCRRLLRYKGRGGGTVFQYESSWNQRDLCKQMFCESSNTQ